VMGGVVSCLFCSEPAIYETMFFVVPAKQKSFSVYRRRFNPKRQAVKSARSLPHESETGVEITRDSFA
jgi:hypothetical protein